VKPSTRQAAAENAVQAGNAGAYQFHARPLGCFEERKARERTDGNLKKTRSG
jgi:hypothetical protein